MGQGDRVVAGLGQMCGDDIIFARYATLARRIIVRNAYQWPPARTSFSRRPESVMQLCSSYTRCRLDEYGL